MSDTLITITLVNSSSTPKDFYFFQEPAKYTGGAEVYSNSLLHCEVSPLISQGTRYQFQLKLKHHAGVQSLKNPVMVGQPSGYYSAIQEIGLTPADGTNTSATIMSARPLGLSIPAVPDASQNVQTGAFRIIVPEYDSSLETYYGGSAVELSDGTIVLSNFSTLTPNSYLDCQPVLTFYVAIGSYESGQVMNFTASSSGNSVGVCDATGGDTDFYVEYTSSGNFVTTIKRRPN
ncbi:hypothetical protein [Pantoea sp. CCBC3-3-1]|uniref:hypothetical protein n=1 Tax=Pantoea sp. CCBC3-3-1 TaxID=2490851 RepID=UPI0011BDA572|nr:hypothetical protein [Pantoea sp. CCBC3-3-1]